MPWAEGGRSVVSSACAGESGLAACARQAHRREFSTPNDPRAECEARVWIASTYLLVGEAARGRLCRGRQERAESWKSRPCPSPRVAVRGADRPRAKDAKQIECCGRCSRSVSRSNCASSGKLSSESPAQPGRKGLVVIERRAAQEDPLLGAIVPRPRPENALDDDQAARSRSMPRRLRARGWTRTFLLQGVTAVGRPSVYLRRDRMRSRSVGSDRARA